MLCLVGIPGVLLFSEGELEERFWGLGDTGRWGARGRVKQGRNCGEDILYERKIKN